jgi:hypothetical protein
MMKVWNKLDSDVPESAVYVGRPTKWGNPFVIGLDGDRDEVIQKFERQLPHSLAGADIEELAGKDLVCWCAPKPCHADVLLFWANLDRTPIVDDEPF